MKAINIKTEYLKNPLGIDIDEPRVMWNCEGGTAQTAYRIVADGWDSGKVKSNEMRCRLPVKFEKGKRVNFKIKLWDENDAESEWSEEAFFEYGIRSWSAKWITGNYEVDKEGYARKKRIESSFLASGINYLIESFKGPEKRFPVDCFRKDFRTDGNIRAARLYATA